MRVPRFYQTIPLAVGAEVTLDTRASHHLTVVLRAQTGAPCALFNGDGMNYGAVIVGLHKKHTLVRIETKTKSEAESPLRIHWGQCISASDRMDYTIQKATELGVTEITPLLSERMTVKWRTEKADKKCQHWQNIAISASEQSFRSQVPNINRPRSFFDFVTDKASASKFILDVTSTADFYGQKPPKGAIILLAGSESGLSQRELDCARHSEFITIGFGPRVLRTETVAPAVLAVVQTLWGDI